MNDNKPDNSPEAEKAQDQTAVPDEQLGDIAGGGYALGGKTVRSDVEVREGVKVKRDGFGLSG